MGLDKYTNAETPGSAPINSTQPQATATGGSSKKLIIIVVVAIILLCVVVGGVLGVLYLNNRSNTAPNNQTPDSIPAGNETDEEQPQDSGECDEEFLEGFDLNNITDEDLAEINERCKDVIEKEGGENVNIDQVDKERREAAFADVANIAKIGETVVVGKLEFTVLEVQNLGPTLDVVDSEEIEKDCTVKNYETYINVKMKIKNNFDKDISLFTQLLLDDSLTQYYSTSRPFCIYDTSDTGNKVEAGKTGEIYLLFDIKKSMNPALLELFDATVFSGGLTEETLKLKAEDFKYGYINIGEAID